MPLMQKIGPAKGYKLPALKEKASPEEVAAHKALAASWEAVKAGGVKEVTAVGASEALQYGKGMYEILPTEAPAAPASAIQMPEEMSDDALKLTALQLGVDLTKKPMKRTDIVKAVRQAMDSIEFAAEDEVEAE